MVVVECRGDGGGGDGDVTARVVASAGGGNGTAVATAGVRCEVSRHRSVHVLLAANSVCHLYK